MKTWMNVDALRATQVMDLVRETFHRGRKVNAVVADSMCSYPELIDTDQTYGFRCRQRRSDGVYRTVESTRSKEGFFWGPRVTTLGKWGEREERMAA